jgi:hypothetical protein
MDLPDPSQAYTLLPLFFAIALSLVANLEGFYTYGKMYVKLLVDFSAI